jgi:hypothetical protein
MKQQFDPPSFLEGRCTIRQYRDWLSRKARAHHKRDTKRGNASVTCDSIKIEIHRAVTESNGKDFYTGLPLQWELIGTYRNEPSKQGRRKYKQAFWHLPTVDHVDEGLGEPNFKICGWRTNDCKSDLTHAEFVEVCRQVIAYYDSRFSVNLQPNSPAVACRP